MNGILDIGSASNLRNPPKVQMLVQFGVQCSLEQMLEDGFYHADRKSPACCCC